MSDRNKDLPEDMELFRDAVDGVQPLKTPSRVHHRPPAPAPEPVQRRLDDREVMRSLLDPPQDAAELETGEELLYLRPGVQQRVMRRLRRGQYSIVDSLDLHHMNEATARDCMMRFIDQSHRAGLGCVRIVHGKGLRSRTKPRLKVMVNHVLRRHRAVMAFASCRPVDGGTGAVSVLLRRKAVSKR